MLVSDDNYQGIGGIAVFQSTQGWQSTMFLGEIPNDSSLAVNGAPTATVQISECIYDVEAFFFDAGVFDAPGSEGEFSFY
jgi:hypothetical protein